MILEFLIIKAFLSVSSAFSASAYDDSYSNGVYPKTSNKPKDAADRPLFNNKFEEVYRWKQMSFVPLDNDTIHFELSDRRINDLTASEIEANFIQYNNLPMGAMHHKDRIFITVPRRRPGIPATLTFVRSSGARKSSPGLQAYPNFRSNALHPQNQPDSKRIVSVYRSRVDSCDRLWFVDTGSLEYPSNTMQIQQPSIWIFDLNTDTLVRRFEIPSYIVTVGHGIASLTVDIDDNHCEDAYAYLPDLVNYRLHVYSFRANQAWSFNDNAFGFDPIGGNFDVSGVQFQWNDGIFSITLGNRGRDGFKPAYFHSMASTSEFAVSTQVLRNQSAAARSYHGQDFRYLGQRNEVGQSAMHVYDKETGIIFYSQVARNAIGCWNTNLSHEPNNLHLIVQDNTTMIYPSDINIDSEGFLWFMTNKLPQYIYANIDPNEYNFRIWRAPIQQAILDTPCQVHYRHST